MMHKDYPKSFSWDFYSKLILLSYSLLQILRWRILPQFMDIYYHILTAWGFIRAGGYSEWDFWQYAPVGRMHIYPPFFHIILATLMKLGVDKIILAKSFEVVLPIAFIFLLWRFTKKNYADRLSFFVLISLSSSFGFYLSLMNYLPATLAMIAGLLLLDQLLQYRLLRCVLLLSLCFYTHIGVAWLFAFTIIFYGLFNQDKESRKLCLIIFLSAVILSFPILFKQLRALGLISISGINARYFFEFKSVDYLLAFLGILQAIKLKKKYLLFLSLFLASFIFLPYPSRFLSAQGYLPVIFLAGIGMDSIFEKIKNKAAYLKFAFISLICFLLFISPTFSIARLGLNAKFNFEILAYDSAFIKMLFPQMNKRLTATNMLLSREFISTRDLIKQNSGPDDIIYCDVLNVGTCLASLSGRASANALFPEIGPSVKFDRVSASKIFIALQDNSPKWLNSIKNKYGLIEIGENKLFIIYKNPRCNIKVNIKKASVSFGIIGVIAFVFALLFWQSKKIDIFIKKHGLIGKA
jgi:hypothetical protein